MLRGAIFSLIALLMLLCGFEAFWLYVGNAVRAAPLDPLSGYLLSHFAFCMAALGCALVLAVIVAFLLTPDMATLARAADRSFALQERLSTALEVDASLRSIAACDPVRGALLADAERCAANIDPRQLVRLDLPRSAWAVPVLMAAAVLLQLVPPDAFGLAASRQPVAGAERDGAGLSGQQAADAAANLKRIAERLGKDAEERSNPYLRTIARTLERLSAEAERSSIDRRVLGNELDRLLAHARQAYGEDRNVDRGAMPRDVAQQFRAALDNIAGSGLADAATPREPKEGGGAGNAAALEQDQAGRSPQPSARKAPGGRIPSETAAPDRPPAARDDVLKDLDDYDVVDPRIEIERAVAAQQRRERAAVQSVGAARDAGRGEGDRAGDGTRPLGNGGLTTMTELTPGGELLLPDQAANDGRRIRLELPPDAALSGVAPPPAGTAADWKRGQEQVIDRPALAAEDRKVVGRYFTRSAEGRDP